MAAALAVLAAIDAICGLRLGRYSRGQDHDHAAALLETVDLPDHTLPNQATTSPWVQGQRALLPTSHLQDRRSGTRATGRVLVDAAEQL